MNASAERARAVRNTVERIRHIEAEFGVTSTALDQIQAELIRLAARSDWFSAQEFPPPAEADAGTSLSYCIAQDPDTNRFALYVQSAISETHAPPHNHDTWAVITGIQGMELNRFYRRCDGGVEQIGSHVVQPGAGVRLLPDELHSIHITDAQPVINFHMYGLALECLTQRQYYDRLQREWKIFAPRDNVIDCRHRF